MISTWKKKYTGLLKWLSYRWATLVVYNSKYNQRHVHTSKSSTYEVFVVKMFLNPMVVQLIFNIHLLLW